MIYWRRNIAETVKTYCRNCPSICGLEMDVEDNTVKAVYGDREHPLTQGYLCIKGQSSKDWQNGEDRLFNHLVKRPGGSFEKITFETALDEVHKKLAAIIDQHGVDSVALYYGTGTNNNALSSSAAKGFMHVLGSPFIFSSMTIDQSAKWVTMGRMGGFLTGKFNITDGDVILIVGANPLVSHASGAMPMTNPMKYLQEGRKRGAKLIVIDPRRTETARRADIHVAIDPGQDAAFFAGIIHIILGNDWHDKEFCEQFVDGLDELRAAVSEFTPTVVSKRAGVTEEELMLVAETFAKAAKQSAHSGTGSNMAPNSNTAEHMIEAMNAICGGYRRAGDIATNLKPLIGSPITQEIVIPPYRSWEHEPKLKSADIGMLFGEYPTSRLPHEIVNEGDKKIRALIAVGGNPLKVIPDVDTTASAFDELELLVTLDPRMTETCEASDYVFSTSLIYERHDYTGPYDALNTFSYANAVEPVVERPEGIIDDWEFFYGMSQRMNKELELKITTFGASHAQIPGPVYTCDMTDKPTTIDLARWLCSHGVTSYDELVQAPQGILYEDMTAVIEPADAENPKLQICAPDVAEELAAIFRASKSTSKYHYTSRRMLESMNSAYSKSKNARRRYAYNPAFMNPADMEEEGFEKGQKIKISSAYGEVVGHVQDDKGLKRGMVSMSHCWGALKPADDPGASQGTNVSALLSLNDRLETINYMPVMSALPIDIAKT